MATACLSTKLEGGSNVKTSIRNVKVFEPAWLYSVGSNPEATKAMLQVEYRTRPNRVENLGTNLSTAYGLVFGQCMNYLWLRLEGQDKWELTSNEQDLIGLLKIIKYLSHKYDEDTNYHHIAYHTLFHGFMLFQMGDYSNSEYKKRFKEQIEVLEAYNGEGSYSGTSWELRRGRLRCWD